jgi:hypothetical protein
MAICLQLIERFPDYSFSFCFQKRLSFLVTLYSGPDQLCLVLITIIPTIVMQSRIRNILPHAILFLLLRRLDFVGELIIRLLQEINPE